MTTGKRRTFFLELVVGLCAYGVARAVASVFSILVVASVFGVVLSGWRLAKVPTAGWIDWLIVAVSVLILASWLALGRGSLDDFADRAADRWLDRRERRGQDDEREGI